MSKHPSISVLAPAVFFGMIAVDAQNAKPKIAVFSGPNATIQHSPPMVTSNKAREKYGLPLLADRNGRPMARPGMRIARFRTPKEIFDTH